MYAVVNPYRFANTGDWSPPDYAGLQIWLDVNQLTGLNDDDACGSWTDLSGNNRHATQATTSKKPLYKTAVQNGKPVLRFDSSDDAMGTGYTTGSTFTMYLVEISSSGIGYARSVSNGDGGGGDCVSIGVRQWGNNAYVDGVISSSVADLGAHQCCLRSDGTYKHYYVDGTAIAADVSNANTLSSLGFGAVNTTYYEPCGADLAEFILYNTDHTTEQRETVEAYLRTKWGLP